tara:strand:+ start:741 stop:1151 length:411 start_codon:yes stop_codon:yes gene_type:complete
MNNASSGVSEKGIDSEGLESIILEVPNIKNSELKDERGSLVGGFIEGLGIDGCEEVGVFYFEEKRFYKIFGCISYNFEDNGIGVDGNLLINTKGEIVKGFTESDRSEGKHISYYKIVGFENSRGKYLFDADGNLIQ